MTNFFAGRTGLACWLLLALFSASARANPTQVIPAPCSKTIPSGQVDPKTGLRSCADVVASSQGVISLIQQNLNTQVQAYYAQPPGSLTGHDLDILNPPGLPFGPPVCNPVIGPFTPSAETTSDRNGNTCGKPSSISEHVDVCYDGSTSVTTTISKNPANGTLEDSYLRGGLVQALTCFYGQVINEIQNQGTLTIQDIGGAASPCATLATAVTGMASQSQAVVATLVAQLGASADLADVINCSTDPLSSSLPGRQAGQYLCTARSSLEAMFSQLAECEIFARTQSSFYNNLGTPLLSKQIVNNAITALVPICEKQCENQFSAVCGSSCQSGTLLHCQNAYATAALLNPLLPKPPPIPVCAANVVAVMDSCYSSTLPIGGPMDVKASACALSCYQKQLPTYFQNFFNTLYPNQPVPVTGDCHA